MIGYITDSHPIDACDPIITNYKTNTTEILMAKRGVCTFLTKTNHA